MYRAIQFIERIGLYVDLSILDVNKTEGDTMLAKSLELELKIYGLLTVWDSTTEELATTLHVTPRALKENVRKLNDFAENLLHIKDLVAVDFKGNYAVNPEHLADKDRLFGYLKEAAYETTPKFQVVLALITNPSIQKNTIAKRLYISTTRVTSIVNQLNTELAPWEIEIVSDNGSLSFGGRELCIRMYSYIILADAFQSLRDSKDIIDYDSPFHYDMKRYTLPKDNAERFKKSALVHLQNVMDIRLSSGHTLDEVEPEKYERLRHFFGVLRDNYDVSRHINPFLKGLTAEKKEQEQLYFNFFVRILFSDGVPENDRRHLMTKLYLSDDLYGKIAMKCVLYLQKVGFLETGTDESFDHLTYFLVMYFVYFDILRTSSFILDDTRFVLPDYYQDEEPSQAKA